MGLWTKVGYMDIKWKDESVCVVIISGYPGAYKRYEISLKEITDGIVFHAGTKYENGKLLTNGGRVLVCSALGGTIDDARGNAYKMVRKINFEGCYYRKDIAKAK